MLNGPIEYIPPIEVELLRPGEGERRGKGEGRWKKGEERGKGEGG